MLPFYENFNAPDRDGWTPIYSAAQDGHLDVLKLLVPLCKNFNDPIIGSICGGSTPFEAALESIIACNSINNYEVIRYLAPLCASNVRYLIKEAASDTNTKYSDQILVGQTELIKLLASLIDNPNAPDSKGWTAIHMAAKSGRIEIYQWFHEFFLLKVVYESSSISRIFHTF